MPNNFYTKYGKRIFDVTASIIGLIVLLPLFIIIAILIKLNDKGPIFYKQKRIGQNFKPFELLKFRTMVVNADKIGPAVTKDGDPRITKIGKFLRKTKLDELPQLWNVIRGDMSIVGPRPEVEKYIQYYKDDYKEILKVKPGITDYATIKFRNEEEILSKYDDTESAYIKYVLPEKIKLYKTYIKEISFFTDLKIIFWTLWRIVSKND
ncbi:MAG: sugar transferase [Sulfurihydrogenibium sp.]|nr:sugar transferase [Sulfurihydrogenibium sp.]